MIRFIAPISLFLVFVTVLPAETPEPKELIPYFRKAYRLNRFSALKKGADRLHRSLPHSEGARYLHALALLFQEEATDLDAYRNDCARAAAILEESVAEFRALAASGENREIAERYFYLGVARWFAGRPLDALSPFKKSFQHDPTRIEALFNLHALLLELGRTAEAAHYRELYEHHLALKK